MAAVTSTTAAITRIALTRTATVVATTSPWSHGGGLDMKTPFLSLSFALLLLSAVGGCGDDEEAQGANVEVATEGVNAGLGDHDVDEGSCEAFCEKANECARQAGREVPEEAADCEQSCQPGGIHRQAPASIHACASEPCGPAFMACSQRAMLAEMRDRDIAVFPPVCQGLCEKSAWCSRPHPSASRARRGRL